LFAGMANIDFTYVVDEIPARNTKIVAGAPAVTSGGPAINAAITFAFLGGAAALATVVGQHSLTSVIREELTSAGVALHDAAAERQTQPPVSAILVIRATGERTIIATGDQAAPLAAGQFNCDPQWFQELSITLVDGLYMPLCVAVAAQAQALGIPVVLDGGSWKPGMSELLPHVNIAVCSDDFLPPGGRDDKDVFAFMQAQGITRVAITRGERAISYMDSGTAGEVAVPQVLAVDTTGAGDIFHGAFCYYMAQPGRSFRDALESAAQVAGFACQYLGTRSWMAEFRAI
jgi:sugar/nucleoside kinase (ribokinase family)